MVVPHPRPVRTTHPVPRPTLTSLRSAVKPLGWVAAACLLLAGTVGAVMAILGGGENTLAVVLASGLIAMVAVLLLLTLAAQHKLARELDEARHHAQRLRDELIRRERSVDHTLRLDRDWDRARQRHHQAMQAHTLMIASHQEDLQTTHDAIEHLRRELQRGLAAERSARLVALARRDVDRRTPTPPQRWLLIIAPQRTGSTWLLDALRCHPRMMLHPTPDITRLLGMGDIGRYPQGLSDTRPDIASDMTEVEIRDGVGAMVPRFDPPASLVEATSSLPAWVVEKVHPEFFDWDAAAFAQRLDELERERGVEVRLVYRLRDPREAVGSMLRYKRHEPRWYGHVAADEVPAFMAKTYEAVRDLAVLRAGPVLAYPRGEDDAAEELRRVFAWLWEGEGGAEAASEIAAWATRATKREARRERRSGTFLGSASDSTHADDNALLQTHTPELRRCEAAYRAMLEGDGDSCLRDRPQLERHMPSGVE